VRLRQLLASGFVVLVLSGCGSGMDPHNYEYADYDADYVSTSHQLGLPAGVTWPAHAQQAPTSEGKVTYERGSGISHAQFFWLCSWAHAYLADPTGPHGKAATVELEKVKGMRLWSNGIDDNLRSMIEQAIAETVVGGSTTWQQLFGHETCAA
jgi:hypothetical protein